MFSGFADVFGNKTTEGANMDLAALLKSNAISHVFVEGLAGDFCVKCTALDAKKEGFDTVVVAEAVRSLEAEGWAKARQELEEAGIGIVSMDGDEVGSVG